MPDNMSVAQRSWTMSQIRSKNTQPERMVRSYLHAMGFRFRLHQRSLPGAPDIVLPRFRTAIFVHGCFWHAHRNCRYATRPQSNRSYWKQKLAGNATRDKRNRKKLIAAGWRVVTVWECEMKHSSRNIQERLLRILEKGRAR